MVMHITYPSKCFERLRKLTHIIVVMLTRLPRYFIPKNGVFLHYLYLDSGPFRPLITV